jgi:hypothetical protein
LQAALFQAWDAALRAPPCNAPRKANTNSKRVGFGLLLARRRDRDFSGSFVDSLAANPPKRASYHGRVIPPHVQPWSRCDPRLLRGLRGVLTDVDDTLTTEGIIPMGVAAALSALRAAGLPVIAVTGRPMGWSRDVAATAPLAAIVAENGAVALLPDAAEPGRVDVEYADDAATRAANSVRLREVAARIEREVPGATLSTDSGGRVTDIAIDHSEFTHLDPAAIDRVVALMHDGGLTATVSSIHVNGWIGAHSKLSGAEWMVRRLFGRELMAEPGDWLYVGDSTNDERMFEALPLCVGVANLARFADRLRHWPAYITRHDRGRGFVEVAEAVLDARGA